MFCAYKFRFRLRLSKVKCLRFPPNSRQQVLSLLHSYRYESNLKYFHSSHSIQLLFSFWTSYILRLNHHNHTLLVKLVQFGRSKLEFLLNDDVVSDFIVIQIKVFFMDFVSFKKWSFCLFTLWFVHFGHFFT